MYKYTHICLFAFLIRRDFYSICQEAGLGGLASKFGLTPGQFGENLRDNYQRHDTEQYPHEPEEAAQEFIQLSGLVITTMNCYNACIVRFHCSSSTYIYVRGDVWN